MTRSIEARLRRLESARNPQGSSGLALIPWGEWPPLEEGFNALRASNPKALIFIPDQAPSVEAWESACPSEECLQ